MCVRGRQSGKAEIYLVANTCALSQLQPIADCKRPVGSRKVSHLWRMLPQQLLAGAEATCRQHHGIRRKRVGRAVGLRFICDEVAPTAAPQLLDLRPRTTQQGTSGPTPYYTVRKSQLLQGSATLEVRPLHLSVD